MAIEGEEGAGVFVAVVGPSGAGKDTVMRGAQARLGSAARIRFARRVVTRPVDPQSEDHDVLSPDAFLRRAAAGGFCLNWEAHGLHYGLDRAWEEAVRDGATVVANVSRWVLTQAADRFPRLAVAHLTASPDILLARIRARGREGRGAAQSRLERPAGLVVPDGALALSIDNSGPVAQSVDALSAFVRGARERFRAAPGA